MIVPHQLNLNKAQMTKIQKGLPIQIKFNDMGSDKGEIVIGLKEGNAKKLYSAFKKGKGCRICMDEQELDYSMKEGSGFFDSVKKIAKSVEKKAVNVGNKVAKPVKKVISKIPAPIRNVLKDEALSMVNGVGGTLGTMISSATGDAELGGMVQSSINGVATELLEGKKLSLGSKILPIAKRAVNVAVDMIEDPNTKMVAKQVVKKAGAGLYGKAGQGLRGSGLTGKGLSGRGLSGGAIAKESKADFEDKMMKREKPVYTTMPVKRKPRFEKGSQEAKDYMASIRAGKKGEGFGSFGKSVGSAFKSGAKSTKKAVFGKRMADEMEYVLPVAGGVMGAVGGSAVGGVAGGAFGSSVGAAGGTALAKDMKKRGYGVKRKVGVAKIKPASDIPTYSPYQQFSSPAFSPFYPKNSFQNGGSGENK
tara:strand:- start:5989 stop:7248 length:1260 start_codon:yes stop_codon:yes gene_type:complete